MTRLLLICLGGALGTGARALVMQAAPRLLGLAFPYGTLIVNVVGSFLISLIMSLSLQGAWISPTLRVVLTTGFLGGLTTFSTFSAEVVERLLAHQLGWALALAGTHLAGSLLMTYLGLLTVGADKLFS